MDVPSSTIDLLTLLKTKYEDKAETDPDIVGTPQYWMKVGVIQLLRELDSYIENRKGY